MAQPLMLAIKNDFGDWFFLPGLGAGSIGLSVVLLSLLILSLLACQWRVRIPGAVTAGERARSVMPRAFGTLAMIAPVVIAATVAYLHFPLSEPQVVVLSSRSRSIVETDRSDWGQGWGKLLDEAGSDSVIDAGGLVDRACQAVADTPPPGGWHRDDPAVIEHLSDVVYQSLLSEVRRVHSIPADSARSAVGSVNGLPSWIVESIELATIKALTQSHNVSHALIRCEPRLTVSGKTWSTAAKSYLESGLTRITATQVRLQKADSRAPVLLSAFLDVVGTNPDRHAVLFFRVDPATAAELSAAEWDEAATVTVYTSDQDRNGRELQITELRRDKQIQACRVKLPHVTARTTASIVHPASGQRLPWPQSRVDIDEGQERTHPQRVTLLCRGEELRWRQTLDQLLAEPSFSAWRTSVQESMLLRLPRNLDGLTIASTPPAAGIVIDARGEGVWVYDAQLRDQIARVPQPRGLDEARQKVPQLTRSGAEGVPGFGSWDGLMLPASDRFVLPLPHDEGEVASALAITEQFQFGRQGLFPERPGPMVSSVMIQTTTSEGTISGRATYFGLIPEAHGLLAINDEPPESYNRERFLAFWTSIFRAVKRAPASEHGPLIADDNSREVGPAVLLNDTQLSELRATGMRGPLFLLAIGLAMFGAWVLVSQWFGQRGIKP